MTPRPKPYLSTITAYVGGKTKASAGGSAGGSVIKLSSNENPRGPSPRALAAYNDAAQTLHRYPEDGCLSLREALAAHHALDASRIIIGAGSDEVLHMLVHAYAGPGDEVIFTEHSFLMYRIFTQQYGATPVAVPERDLTTDITAILAAVSDKTKLVFVANPNNPTGTYIPGSELKKLREALSDDILLVVDGAYHEYVDAPDYADGSELIAAGTNTVITRTFSKIYGLPALRLGWGYGPKHIIDMLYKVRSPFNVPQPAIAAGIAALADTDYTQTCIRENREQYHRLFSAITALGLTVTPSQGNFILVHFGTCAADANAFLMARGIIPREVANYGLPHCLRITIGTADDNTALLAALKEFIET